MQTLLECYKENPTRYKGWFFDIDGTLLLGNTPIPGAAEIIQQFRKDGVPFRFLTNNSSNTHEQIATRLNSMGIEAYENEVVSCGDAVPGYLRQMNTTGKELVFFKQGRMEDIPGVVRFEEDPAKIMECDGVLHTGGLFDWRVTLTAFINFFVRYPEKPMLISNPDMLNPLPGGTFSVCPNGQIQLVRILLRERGIEKEPVLFGKPYKPIYDFALNHLGMPEGTRPDEIVGVGDLLTSDILGANRNGLTSALVLTGLTTAEMAAAAEGDKKPKLVFSRLA